MIWREWASEGHLQIFQKSNTLLGNRFVSAKCESEANSAKGRKDKDSFQSAKESIKALFKLFSKK